MGAAEKPLLEAVLDHYAVRYSPNLLKQMTNCPLHEDNTPSMSVDLNVDLWNCKSCGSAGDSYSLIMKMENCNFRAALDLAAAEQFPTRAADGSGGGVQPGSFAFGRGQRVSRKPRGGKRDGGFVPAWRR